MNMLFEVQIFVQKVIILVFIYAKLQNRKWKLLKVLRNEILIKFKTNFSTGVPHVTICSMKETAVSGNRRQWNYCYS